MPLWKMALLAAVALSILWLLSPGRSAQAPEPGVVEIMYMGPGGPLSGAMDDAVREFEAESRKAHERDHSKPIYRVVSGQNASRDQTADPTRFIISLAGGIPPDVITFDRFAVTEWASRGAFQPLDEYLARDSASQNSDAILAESYFKSAWDEVVYVNPLNGEQHVYGVPTGIDTRAFFYNKDLLKRAGYVDENGEARPPKTWEELEVMAEKLTERDAQGKVQRMGFVPNYGNSWLYIYGWMNGGEFMSADGRRVTMNEPRIVEALDWMARLYDKLGGASEVTAFQSTFQGNELDPFLTGKIVMKIDGFWQLPTNLAQFGRNLNYGVAPPPMPAKEIAAGRQTLSWAGGWCYAIPATAKQKEGAWDLIRFLSSARAQKIIAESGRLSMESQGRVFVPDLSANRKINQWLFDTYVQSNASIDPKLRSGVKVFTDLIDVARYRPVTPVGQLMWNQHVTATENAIFRKTTAQAALDDATRNVQRDLDRVLSPPAGTVVNWNWFFLGYALILIVTGAIVYWWDTHAKRGGRLEGAASPLFRSQWKGGWLCAMPWILGFVIFTGGPILFSIIISFCEYDILNPARLTGFGNYAWMLRSDPLFWKSLWNTLYMVIGIPAGMALSLGIALLLNVEVRGVAMWRTFFYLPAIVPAVASSILWIWILNPTAGLLNNVLASFGIAGPAWLQDEHTSKISLILMGLWGAGGGMIIWLAGLKGIAETYYEAAVLDGAGVWQRFLHVTLPMLSPYIFFNLIMGLIGTFQIFTQAFIMTQGGPVNSTLFYAYHLFNNAFRYLHMGYAAAMAWFLFIIVLGLTVVQMKLSKRWVHYEGD